MSAGCGCGGACGGGGAGGCDCCAGVSRLTPATITNRPGLGALRYRVGTYGAFMASMDADLSNPGLLGGEPPNPMLGLHARTADDLSIALLDAWACVGDVLTFYQERIANEGYLRTATELFSVLQLARLVGYELRPGVAASTFLSIALEDGYRIAVPAGLRAQSVPAAPGAATGTTAPTTGAAAGAAAIAAAAAGMASGGGSAELPQTFETSETVDARAEWNELVPRQTAPPAIDLEDPSTYATLHLQGTPNVAAGARLLLVDTQTGTRRLLRVSRATQDFVNQRTEVEIVPPPATGGPTPAQALAQVLSAAIAHPVSPRSPVSRRIVGEVLTPLLTMLQTGPPERLPGALREAVTRVAELVPADPRDVDLRPWAIRLRNEIALTLSQIAPPSAGHEPPEIPTVHPAHPESVRDQLGHGREAFAGLKRLVTPLLTPPARNPPSRYALSASPGALSPPGDAAVSIAAAFHPELDTEVLYRAWDELRAREPTIEVHLLKLTASAYGQSAPKLTPPPIVIGDATTSALVDPALAGEDPSTLYLDADYPQLTAGGYVVIELPVTDSPDQPPRRLTFRIAAANSVSRADYGLTGRSTRLSLDGQWWSPDNDDNSGFPTLRTAAVFTDSEPLQLAPAPLTAPIRGARIELDGALDGLTAGRWMIVSGQRVLGPAPGLPTVAASELVMVADVRQHLTSTPGDTTHTWIELAAPLAYVYERSSVKVFANVVRATHGETTTEVLGSGDAAQARQRFTLSRSPLTYTAAATPSGVASSLIVRVNEVQWHEAPGLAAMDEGDRSYLTQSDERNVTSVVFGDGTRGVRLPTGIENVAATYRTGIGAAGNLAAGRITQLASKPLGVRAVNNPIAASGGADRDGVDETRHNAPLSVTALDRLVSVQDYEDFSRVFAGIGKASAAALSDGRRRLVHVTIAGSDDIPIDQTSDLYTDLLASLQEYGDPELPVALAVRELLALTVAARVRVLPDFSWPLVEPNVRARLLGAFGFAARELGQDATAGRVLACIQTVPGVQWAELDAFASITGDAALTERSLGAAPASGTRRAPAGVRVRALPARVVGAAGGREILPAQIAVLGDDTLQLSEDRG
jgi:predicted phage baseplate assembly protein